MNRLFPTCCIKLRRERWFMPTYEITTRDLRGSDVQQIPKHNSSYEALTWCLFLWRSDFGCSNDCLFLWRLDFVCSNNCLFLWRLDFGCSSDCLFLWRSDFGCSKDCLFLWRLDFGCSNDCLCCNQIELQVVDEKVRHHFVVKHLVTCHSVNVWMYNTVLWNFTLFLIENPEAFIYDSWLGCVSKKCSMLKYHLQNLSWSTINKMLSWSVPVCCSTVHYWSMLSTKAPPWCAFINHCSPSKQGMLSKCSGLLGRHGPRIIANQNSSFAVRLDVTRFIAKYYTIDQKVNLQEVVI